MEDVKDYFGENVRFKAMVWVPQRLLEIVDGTEVIEYYFLCFIPRSWYKLPRWVRVPLARTQLHSVDMGVKKCARLVQISMSSRTDKSTGWPVGSLFDDYNRQVNLEWRDLKQTIFTSDEGARNLLQALLKRA